MGNRDKPLKIALVCSEVIKESGHGRYMLELARRLAGDHEVHVFSHLYTPVPGVHHHPIAAPLGINLVRVFVFWARASLALAGHDFDVVHTIGGCCTRRDVVTAQFLQRPWGAQLASLPAAERVGSAWRRFYHALYWRACDLLEAPAFGPGGQRRLIAVSEGVRQELASYYGADPSRVTVIYNGVEPSDFAPTALAPLRAPTRAELGLAPDTPALLFIGDFYRKGLGVTLEAMARLADRRANLVVVGRGEIAAFRARALALGLAGRVHFVDFQADVLPYFAAADVFIFPTRYEPFGMVLTEAMASGLPVVTSRAAGAAEVITHGVDGLVIADPDDADALAAALDGLLADPVACSAMGQAARLAAARVDWDYVARETLAVYRTMISERTSQ